MNTQPESFPAHDDGLGLAEIAPAEPPADFWEHAVSVAVDPSTPPVEDIDVPGDDDPAPGPDPAEGDDVDLSEFDDDPSSPAAATLAPDDAEIDDVNDIDSLATEDDILAPPETPMDQQEPPEPYPDSADLGTVEQGEGAADVDDPSAF